MSEVSEAELVIGVDTHLDTHTAAICDARGRAVSQLQVPATTAKTHQYRCQCLGTVLVERFSRAGNNSRLIKVSPAIRMRVLLLISCIPVLP